MSDADEDLLSLRGYARYRGWSPSYVHKLVHEQGLPRHPDGKIDPVEADEFIAQNLIGRWNDGVRIENERRRRRRDRAASQGPAPRATNGVTTHVPDLSAVVARYRHRILASVDQEVDRMLTELTKGKTDG